MDWSSKGKRQEGRKKKQDNYYFFQLVGLEPDMKWDMNVCD